MFWSAVLRASRTTYRGSRGSGPGASSGKPNTKTTARSSPSSRSSINAYLDGHLFKRAQRGLYDGAMPQSGHNVPKSIQKTLRTWRPNVQRKHLWSDILGRKVATKVTTRALRTMKKYGGLDAYLQRRNGRLLGEWGRGLRSQLGATVRMRQQQTEMDKLMLDESGHHPNEQMYTR